MNPKIGQLIIQASEQTGISSALIAAVIHQESRGQVYAIRYEPGFYRKYLEKKTREQLIGFVPSAASLDTELYGRACSYGLMQVMGNTMRERGFKGQFLTELLDPATNIRLGSEFLQTLLLRHKTTEKALQRWNGGGNPEYAKQVLAHLDSGAAHYLFVG